MRGGKKKTWGGAMRNLRQLSALEGATTIRGLAKRRESSSNRRSTLADEFPLQSACGRPIARLRPPTTPSNQEVSRLWVARVAARVLIGPGHKTRRLEPGSSYERLSPNRGGEQTEL